ncbi:hypothetical protein GQ42DRAFT_21996 [Ramicandelaber brevisporus]|nr:hypothetical protein GQ42DRAFT_21996 [Ramicandelaber brevisporus]
MFNKAWFVFMRRLHFAYSNQSAFTDCNLYIKASEVHVQQRPQQSQQHQSHVSAAIQPAQNSPTPPPRSSRSSAASDCGASASAVLLLLALDCCTFPVEMPPPGRDGG